MTKLADLIEELRSIRPTIEQVHGRDSEVVRQIDSAIESGTEDDLALAVRLVQRDERIMGVDVIEGYRKICKLGKELLGSHESALL